MDCSLTNETSGVPARSRDRRAKSKENPNTANTTNGYAHLDEENQHAQEEVQKAFKLLFHKNKECHSMGEKALDRDGKSDDWRRRGEPDWSRFEHRFSTELLPKDGSLPMTEQFLREVHEMVVGYLAKNNDRSYKVIDFHQPDTLRESMGHCIDIHSVPQDLEQILSDVKETFKYCVRTGHPRFFNQLSQGLDPIALVGEYVTAAANSNMFTYEISPVFVLMEDVVLTRMRAIIGWQDGDGLFTPGGSSANMHAVAAARHKFFPQIKEEGLSNIPKLVMFTSEQSHYSIKQAAATLGIGTRNVKLIKCDERGKLIPEDLERQIVEAKADGCVPFFVNAVAGSTVLGAFDPIGAIADICQRHRIWLHVDAAWGGGAMMCSRLRSKLNGIKRADSVTWNPHKMMGITLQCSAILLQDKELLARCNTMHADYLFQKDKNYDTSYDTGDKAMQCGRRNDVFKLWLTWRAKGDIGFEEQIDSLFQLSRYLLACLKDRSGFELVLEEPEYTNVCFWYMPTNMRHLAHGPERSEILNKVAPKIKAMMMERGNCMVGYQPLGSKPNFFRMVLSNPATTQKDIDFLLHEIETIGEDIFVDI